MIKRKLTTANAITDQFLLSYCICFSGSTFYNKWWHNGFILHIVGKGPQIMWAFEVLSCRETAPTSNLDLSSILCSCDSYFFCFTAYLKLTCKKVILKIQSLRSHNMQSNSNKLNHIMQSKDK